MIESTMSDTHAQYEPVAWWFTRRRLGRELRNLYQAAEELPPQLLTLVRKLGGKSDSSLEARKAKGAARHGINEVVILRDQLFEASVWLNQAAGRVRVFPRYGHFFELNLPDMPRLSHVPPYLQGPGAFRPCPYRLRFPISRVSW
jgi:hypothetical protein